MGKSSRFASLGTVLLEKPESDLLDDIQHWIRVYVELRTLAQEVGSVELTSECEERLNFWLAKTETQLHGSEPTTGAIAVSV